jgi:DNA-binding GntR family transcriptional regulator
VLDKPFAPAYDPGHSQRVGLVYSIVSSAALPDHKQLRNIVIDRLHEMISQGELQPGEWVRQERLARELGVSHTPIREALKQLQAEGLVEHVPYRGVRVVEFSLDDVVDIYTMRSALEGLAAAAAALRASDDELAEIRRLHEAMVACKSPIDDLPKIRELNRSFHRQIVLASRRTYLIRTLEQMWSWFPTMLWNRHTLMADASTPERADTDNREHEQIVAALEARDPQRAEHLIREHIDHSRQALLTHLNAKRQDTAS